MQLGDSLVPIFTIAELERLTGVPRTTIHFYLRHGLLPRPQKATASRSLYTEDHVKGLAKIAELKKLGLSITEIEEELRHATELADQDPIDLTAQEYDRTHNRILALAAQEFTTHGYKNTHVTTIIKKLGITATLFYSHFPGKRKLLAECLSVIHEWIITYADSKRGAAENPAERFLWLVFASFRVFELGSAGLALTLVEKGNDDGDLGKSVQEVHARVVDRIVKDLTEMTTDEARPATVPDELVGHSLQGAFVQTVFRSYMDDAYTRSDLLRTHLWLFLAAQAARNGEIDLGPRLAAYEDLIEQFATRTPPLPPIFES
jgi:DNA-binding transcriptional MerR regulator